MGEEFTAEMRKKINPEALLFCEWKDEKQLSFFPIGEVFFIHNTNNYRERFKPTHRNGGVLPNLYNIETTAKIKPLIDATLKGLSYTTAP